MIQLCASICSSIFCRIFYLVLVIMVIMCNGSIVGGVQFVTFFVEWCYYHLRPVIWWILYHNFLLNRFVNVLVIISPPAFINSEAIPSTPCDLLLASCFIEYLTSCSVIGGMFSLLTSTESNSCRAFVVFELCV